MSSTALPMSEALEAWALREEPGGPVRMFARLFAGIWLAYDLADLASRGTAGAVWLANPGSPLGGLAGLQLGLAACELALLAGRRARPAALAACLLRAVEALVFMPLNDFYYYCVTAFILSQARLDPREGPAEPAWIREALLAEAAWIYASTALLKLNPVWLSGGHLYVRHAYLASRGWPYPSFFRAWISTPSADAVLARLAAAAEFLLAALLARRAPRRWCAGVALILHGYAALALNVWFFGASMVAQAACLAPPSQPKRQTAATP